MSSVAVREGLVIGVDIGGTKVAAGLVDPSGGILCPTRNYVGAEVSIGSFLVNYYSQPDIGNIPEKPAAGFVSYYWGGAMMGRFIGSQSCKRCGPELC